MQANLIICNVLLHKTSVWHLAVVSRQEVFKSDIYDSAPFNKVVGKCFVMFVKDYFKLKPEVSESVKN